MSEQNSSNSSTVNKDAKEKEGKRRKKILPNILHLLKKEFNFKLYDEETGLVMKKDNEKYQYRGFSIWLKEVVESLFALFIILFALYFFSTNFYDFFHGISKESIESIDSINSKETIDSINSNESKKNEESIDKKLIQQILKYGGFFLAIDALFLIAVLISSPGIDETIDSMSVSLSAFLVLILGSLDFDKIKETPLLIISTVLPLSILIILSVYAKHYIKAKLNKKNN